MLSGVLPVAVCITGGWTVFPGVLPFTMLSGVLPSAEAGG